MTNVDVTEGEPYNPNTLPTYVCAPSRAGFGTNIKMSFKCNNNMDLS